jgi:hypothetical protein
VSSVSHGIDRFDATFDDPSLVANAGLLVVATLVTRLGLELLINETVRLVGRVGGASPGRKILTLVHTIVAGGSHIDHVDMLRAGATQAVLPFRVMAPSTLGTFLRCFTFGHIRQLDNVIAETIRRAWAAGSGPRKADRLVMDLDSTICETYGKQKQGVAYGYTGRLGYHPLLATRADTGEVLHARMRKGSSQRGHRRFVEELVARVRRCGVDGEVVLRADSGFWSNAIIDALDRLSVAWSITVTQNKGVKAAIADIAEDAWVDIDYTEGGQAQVAEYTYTTGTGNREITRRLIVRRTRLTDPAQRALWPDWRHHAFITNLADEAIELDKFHRHHAVVELAIRDLKEGAGLEHCPSGKFFANSAWLACAVIAHNLIRWTASLGGVRDGDQLIVARRVRTRIVALPARIVNRSGRQILRLPINWPWAKEFNRALDTLRSLPLLA